MALFFNNRRDMGNIAMGGGMYPSDPMQDERFGVDPATQGAVDRYASLPAPVMEGRKGGGFGDVLRALAGGVLDGVATHYGAEAGYSGARKRQQDIMDRARAAAEARQNEWQDWKQRQDYTRENQAPADPYRTEDNVGNVWEIGADGKKRLLFADDTPKYYMQGDQAIQIPNQYASGGSQGGGMASGAQEGATATNPQTGEKLMFRGGQWVPAGGGTGNGAGGFRP